MMKMWQRLRLVAGVLILAGWIATAQEPPKPAVPTAPPGVKDPFESVYKGYDPGFRFPDKITEEEKKLSSEPRFQTLNLLPESSRAYALVEAGKAKEAEGRFREALDIYQKVIDEYPDVLYRVSEFGVFVPIPQYCQLRILAFPREDLAFYRVKHDSRAKESFELARQRNSLEGLAEIRDKMLCTSAGAPALTTLGFSALDQGHYLEALEYFETVWNNFPESRTQNPALPMSISLCRKMLGIGDQSGERFGLIGHWKLDEGQGNKAADSSGLSGDGVVEGPLHWVEGRTGSAQRFDWTNVVSVRASTFLNIGASGAGFSVSLWLKLERPNPHPEHALFGKYRGADQHFVLGVVSGNGQVGYAIATQSPKWETGNTKNGAELNRWTHVAFVKTPGNEARLYLNGKLETREALKAPANKNTGGIMIGRHFYGAIDDVRLYNRALLDREIADMAGAVGTAAVTAAPASGEAPLTVEFTAGATEGDFLWEFGDGETAKGPKVRHTYGLGGEYTAVLTATDPKGPISVGRAKVSVKWNPRDEDFRKRMEPIVAEAKYDKPVSVAQLASPAGVTADDYALMPPTLDPPGLATPVWEEPLAGSRLDFFLYTQPVVTKNSVIYRHRNMVYCRSILNGELRWKNDTGGRVKWQNLPEVQFPQEDVLVQDGMVFTPLHKVGPTLVALDEITGRIRWAYGPMVATSAEEANLRFETAPAGGPMTVYASYILDNIEGDTHTDSEYGIMAFDSLTGRVKWRRPVCSLRPGQFSAGFAVKRRNKIRSFLSPPLYFQGTVYYNTNAGALAALDALSGQIKWVMRYPYYSAVHDSTRQFGGLEMYENNPLRHYRPQFWYNQRPLLVGDDLYVLPQDAPTMYCIDRRTGRIRWSTGKADDGSAYLLGLSRNGELVMATSIRGGGGGVHLLDPATGATLWQSGDPIAPFTQPVMKYFYYYGSGEFMGANANRWDYQLGARPFLSHDGKVYLTGFHYWSWPVYGFSCNLAVISLEERKLLDRRHYMSGEILTRAAYDIGQSVGRLKAMEDIPHKDERTKKQIEEYREITQDTVPINEYGPFLPFSRVTFQRFGADFELRMTPRSIAMVYDTVKVRQALAGRTDPDGLFARGELEMGERNLTEAARLMKQCLASISPEDLDFRQLINQLLFQVNKALARSGVRIGQADKELAYCIGMNETVGTLSDEIETLFALSEAYERKGDLRTASRHAQNIVSTYGSYEYPVPSLLGGDVPGLMARSQAAIDSGVAMGKDTMYGQEVSRSMTLMRKGLPLYFSALSPLEKDLNVRAGELASGRLLKLKSANAEFARDFDKRAEESLGKKPAEEQIARLWEFPGTETAQKVLETLMTDAIAQLGGKDVNLALQTELRKRLWRLADAARICALKVPDGMKARLLAPQGEPAPAAVAAPLQDQPNNLEEERGTAWLVLDRKGQPDVEPDWLFLGGRVKKKVDNKFVLTCMDLASGKVVWKAQEKRGDEWFDEIRLAGKGDEPGFFQAFVHRDTVVVHGRSDVLSFHLRDGKLKWRYQVPFNFEIKHAEMSGDLLALAGEAETLVLHLGTDDPRGEVVWQEKEEGDLYTTPYFYGDRLVSLRKMPFNLTVRYRSTGKLMGRLNLPDLLLYDGHPLVENGPRELPVARDGTRLVVTDGWYYIMLDVERAKIAWKRLIEANDMSRLPPLRFALNGDYLAVLKQDFDIKAIGMFSSRTGDLLWRTDPKDANSPQPIYSMVIRDGKLFGIRPHAGQGFYFTALDCKTGKPLFGLNEQAGYGGKPEVALRPEMYGARLVAMIRDRQDFELKVFDTAGGKLLHTVKVKAAGDFGEHGRASATVQSGKLALLGKNDLVRAVGK